MRRFTVAVPVGVLVPNASFVQAQTCVPDEFVPKRGVPRWSVCR